MPNFTFPLHKYDSKKSLNWQQVLLRLAPTLVKVNDLMPLRQEFSNSAPKIFGVEYTDSTLGGKPKAKGKSGYEKRKEKSGYEKRKEKRQRDLKDSSTAQGQTCLTNFSPQKLRFQ